jgi:hypothetical protein
MTLVIPGFLDSIKLLMHLSYTNTHTHTTHTHNTTHTQHIHNTHTHTQKIQLHILKWQNRVTNVVVIKIEWCFLGCYAVWLL